MAGKLTYRHTGAKALSHSRLEALDSCGRKFELEGKLNLRKCTQNLTFAYGHAFGEGVQAMFEGKSWNEIVWIMFSTWEVALDLRGYDSEVKNKKDFWNCLEVVERLFNHFNTGDATHYINSPQLDMDQWEIAKIRTESGDIKPAIELEFEVDCGDGYFYEGHIDLVLQHKHTKRFAILELKTSGLWNVHEALYGNSPQPTSYLMALDTALVGAESEELMMEFDVFYLVAQTSKQEFLEFKFTKTPLHRAQWIEYIVGKIAQIETYESLGISYPINFKSCLAFNRPCSKYGICHLPNEQIMSKWAEEGNLDTAYGEEPTPPDFSTTLDAIIERNQKLLENYEVEHFDIPLTMESQDLNKDSLALLNEIKF